MTPAPDPTVVLAPPPDGDGLPEARIKESPRFLTKQQAAFYETFGFVVVRGAFRRDIAAIAEAFDDAFRREPNPIVMAADNSYHRTDDPAFQEQSRLIIPGIVDRTPGLRWLRDDKRVLGIVRSVLGNRVAWAESDGNLFNCNVFWHIDAFGAPIEQAHVKLYFYLDPLEASSGALRVVPGTNDLVGPYASKLRQVLADIDGVPDQLGIPIEELPSWTLEVQPGDVVVGNFRTVHGSFNGGVGRRLFTMNYRQRDPGE